MQLTNLLRDRHPSLRRRRVAPRLHGKFPNAAEQILSLPQGLIGYRDARSPELNIPDPLVVIRQDRLLKNGLPERSGIIGGFGYTLLGRDLFMDPDNPFLYALQAPSR
jgi:hypothetical protein